MKVTVCDACGYRIDNRASVEVKVAMHGSNPRLGGELSLDYCDECAESLYDELEERRGMARLGPEEVPA